MNQKLPFPIKYKSEEEVKKALKIESFRELSKDKVIKFASMLPYMDKDVALAVINQFPSLAEYGKTMLTSYKETCDNIISKNQDNQQAIIQAYRLPIEALSKRLENPQISEDERKAITDDIIKLADKIAEADYKNKNFMIKILKTIGWFFLAAFLGLLAYLGVNSTIGKNNGELPEIDDDDDNNKKEV